MSTGLDLASLIKRHQHGVWRYLRALGCDRSQADELTQETFLAVLQKPFDDYHPAATAAYLRKVARNLFITWQRRAARSATTVNVDAAYLDQIDATWSRWTRHDDGETLQAALRDCLGSLAERARQALEMRFAGRMSRAEMAAALGLSEDGVKNLLQRAKQRLRECIEGKLG